MAPRRRIYLAILVLFCLSVTGRASAQLQPGIVVEEVAKGSEGEKAGLQPGDILQNWVRGDAHGGIESPFELMDAEIEQEPRSNVTLQGLRGTEKRTWTLGPDVWGIKVRPDLPPNLLLVYLEGEELAKAGKVKEAAGRWYAVAGQLDRAAPANLRLWLLLHAAKTLAEDHESKESDHAYVEVMQSATGSAPAIRAVLLRSWADASQQRADWSSAEKHYTEAAEESKKLGAESLMLADTLDHIGSLALDAGDLDKAKSYYLRALDIQQSLAPDSLSLAGSLNGLGNTAQDQGDLDKAVAYHRQALAIRQRLAPGSMYVARSLGNLGNLALNRDDLAKAEEYYRQTLAIQETVAPGSLGVGMTLSNLGIVAKRHGELAKAEQYAYQAYTVRKKAAPDSLDVAMSLAGLGVLADDRGDLAKAERYYLQALSIDRKISPENTYVALVLSNLGNVAYQRGDYARAEEYQRQALKIRKKLGAESMQLAIVLNNLGDVLWHRNHPDQAQQYLQQSLAIEQKLAPGSLNVADTLNDLGDMATDQGDLSKAEQYCLQAFTIRTNLAPSGIAFADSLMSLGDLARKHNDLAKAEEFYRQALAIREKLSPGSTEHAESLTALAGIAKDKPQLDAASQLYEQALNVLEKQITRLGGSEQVRSGFRAQHADDYKDYIDLLITQKQPGHAFGILERFRARSLLETLAAAHVDIRKGVDPAWVEQERSLQELIAAKSRRRIELLSQKDTEKQVAAFDSELKTLFEQYQDVEGQIRAGSPTYAALTQPEPLDIKQVQQQLLDNDTLLLEYSLGKERSYVFAVTADSLDVYQLPKAEKIETLAQQIYGELTASSQIHKHETALQKKERLAKAEMEYPPAVAKLSQMILGPVAAQLQQKRLLIVGDGALQDIPFSILPDLVNRSQSQLPLVASHEIVNLPSASVLAILRREELQRKLPSKAVAVLADPVFSAQDERVERAPLRSALKPTSLRSASQPDDGATDLPEDPLTRSVHDLGMLYLPRLPFTRREADSILSVTPAGEGLKAVDFQANRELSLSPELANYRIVHFATHGLVDNERPELSGLVLSLVDQQGNKQNGFLGLEDIYNLNLPVDMVVLSACETGLGKQINGEGLIGLTRGFMYAGADRVVASLWSVDDVATAELMSRFYKGILQQNLSPAAALREAQVEMWKQKRWRNPYYWGAFELQGEWKPLMNAQSMN